MSLIGKVVVGAGAACIDYVGYVEHFPKPDEKMHTKELRACPGGNALQALVCLCRLGGKGRLVSKLGDDALGAQVLKGIKEEGVDIDYIVVKKGISTPFSYIISDLEKKSRTIIHTPSEALTIEEVETKPFDSLFNDAGLMLCDSRNGIASAQLAKKAHSRGIKIVLDCDKRHPGFDIIALISSYLIFNSGFLLEYTSCTDALEALATALNLSENTIFVVGTFGEKGCILLQRYQEELEEEGDIRIYHCFSELENSLMLPSLDTSCRTQSTVTKCVYKPKGYSNKLYTMYYCTAYPLDATRVVDTTGAGDVFVGSICYGIVHQLTTIDTLKLASFQSGMKCTGTGAKFIPKRADALSSGLRLN